MIIVETLADGRTYTYSDAGMKIMQETGVVYDDAVDQIGVTHTYTETDTPIDSSRDATEDDYVDALEELGVSVDEEENT